MSKNINDLNENVFNEVLNYLSIDERVRCELVCTRWRSILMRRSQKVIKLCFGSVSNQTKFVCSTKMHQPCQTDIVYFPDDENAIDTNKIDQLFTKFTKIKSIHLQSKDIRILKRSNVLTRLSKWFDNIEHFEVDIFYGPFTRNDLQLLFKSHYSTSLKHLVIRFQNDLGKYLNRKTIMKFFEICIEIELFYYNTPYLTTQNLEYVPLKLNSLYLNETELDLFSLNQLVQENKTIFKQLRLTNVTSEHLNCITSNLSYLIMLSLDGVQLTNKSNGLDRISKLQRLEVLRFSLDDNGQEFDNRIDKEMISILRECNSIRKIHIQNALITDKCLMLISICSKNLQSFKLYSCFKQNRSQITDRTLNEFLKLNLHTLALPNYSLSQHLLEQLIDKPNFRYLILREPCLFVDKLFERFLNKATIAYYNRYKLKINDEEIFLNLSMVDRPSNFEFSQSKIFNFDLF